MKLVARGPDTKASRLKLRDGVTFRMGRAPQVELDDLLAFGEADGVETWAIPWDNRISRNHALIRLESNRRLFVERLPEAKNPIFFNGEYSEAFALAPTEHFVVGDTSFHFLEDAAHAASGNENDQGLTLYTEMDLRGASDRDSGPRLDLLADFAPIIRESGRRDTWVGSFVSMMLKGLSDADVCSLVRTTAAAAGEIGIDVREWDARYRGITDFRPSRRLIVEAVHRKKQTVSFVWTEQDRSASEFTAFEGLDWAFCTPLKGETLAGWGLYVAGRSGPEGVPDLKPDVKFVELLAELLSAVADLHVLRERQSSLRRFFSPVMLGLLGGLAGEAALTPRTARVTVLFCDLKGFSRVAERAKDDLLGLLHRVSQALDVMTDAVHRHHGVVGDFQGDSALAFWGWPLTRPDSAVLACRAALEIRDEFIRAAKTGDATLAGLACGIGIASGEAVAGKLGSSARFKIDVFGPVVNLAARLEALTRRLTVPVLVDEETRLEVLGSQAPASFRFRRLARVRPYGLQTAVDVSELLPLSGDPDVLSDEDVEKYEMALGCFVGGAWDEAHDLLHKLPAWDKGKDVLLSHILSHRREPPPNWDGVISFDAK